MGVFVYVIDNAEVDGASAIVDAFAFAFVSERFGARMLFTLAHEVGHLIAHHGNGPFAAIDENVERSSGGNWKKEAYASTFASSLLMPRKSVAIALQTIRRAARIDSDQLGDIEINYLARIYGVSFWAAARRCEDLDLIPPGGANALNTQIVKDYGSAEKRADELGLPPRPKIRFPKVPHPLMDAAVANVRAGTMSVGRAASALGVSISDLYAANAPTKH
jgi:Zn-dependent peptidase ImmA (M78 family)